MVPLLRTPRKYKQVRSFPLGGFEAPRRTTFPIGLTAVADFNSLSKNRATKPPLPCCTVSRQHRRPCWGDSSHRSANSLATPDPKPENRDEISATCHLPSWNLARVVHQVLLSLRRPTGRRMNRSLAAPCSRLHTEAAASCCPEGRTPPRESPRVLPAAPCPSSASPSRHRPSSAANPTQDFGGDVNAGSTAGREPAAPG